MQTVKTLIADDDARFRRRVRDLLASEPDLEIVGEAADGHDAIGKARELKPDLVLMDVRMPGMSGLDAARRLKLEMPGLKIIVLTLYELEEYKEAALACGVNHYIVKQSLLDELVPAIRSIAQSHPCFMEGRAETTRATWTGLSKCCGLSSSSG
jgi:DNA-binding NarL/FixJ family response regulator